MSCYACGDPANGYYNQRPVCSDCFNELVLGWLPNYTVHFPSGSRSKGPKEDDVSPLQQNAIKAMEERRQ